MLGTILIALIAILHVYLNVCMKCFRRGPTPATAVADKHCPKTTIPVLHPSYKPHAFLPACPDHSVRRLYQPL